jgi:hypothetical protein
VVFINGNGRSTAVPAPEPGTLRLFRIMIPIPPALVQVVRAGQSHNHDLEEEEV